MLIDLNGGTGRPARPRHLALDEPRQGDLRGDFAAADSHVPTARHPNTTIVSTMARARAKDGSDNDSTAF
ncbi:hypothetical protein ACFOWE_29560 [Planomonospora corallina]|uniref:Uncharacterized protein n=1 Tax=Planomonospora corallina TaxID=1806052 RepID=A0ABV8IHK1_9ACTN